MTDPAREPISVNAIGYVRSGFSGYAPSEEMRREPSTIVVYPEFAGGLMGLQPGDQILTLFVLHRAAASGYELQLHPGHNPVNPIRGVFGTRSQYRPNFIGATVASILDVRVDESSGEGIVDVTELDAQDGSPVIDIKHHHSGYDGGPETG
jgi:tRNA-Thr(GGU) m(6)t(6)A37 methyltransferase TsaA